MENLPVYVYAVFGAAVLLTFFFFYKATGYSRTTLLLFVAWLVIQGGIALTGFYTETQTLPPRFLLLVAPPLVFIVLLFTTARGKTFISRLDLKTLTLLHCIRIPVELVLLWLSVHKAVPELMTFEGRNFDIFSGITAPFVYYFGFVKNKLNRRILLAWNIVCLALLLHIVTTAVLAAPTPFQQLAFEQPNTGVFYFPFVFLPGFIVPVVLLSHLVAIRSFFTTRQ